MEDILIFIIAETVAEHAEIRTRDLPYMHVTGRRANKLDTRQNHCKFIAFHVSEFFLIFKEPRNRFQESASRAPEKIKKNSGS
jgi:hypothetical protein